MASLLRSQYKRRVQQSKMTLKIEKDFEKINVPARVLHGEDDQIVPVKKSAKLIKGAKELYYPGAPHGITATHQERINADLLTFLKS